jgi:hypothetical protein
VEPLVLERPVALMVLQLLQPARQERLTRVAALPVVLVLLAEPAAQVSSLFAQSLPVQQRVCLLQVEQ